MLEKELRTRTRELKNLIEKSKEIGETFRMFYSRLGIDCIYMERLFRGEVSNFPHPEILKKISQASQGRVTYEELTRTCGYAIRDLVGVDSGSILRGQIYYVDLGEGIGSEQAFIRPCLVVSNDMGNKYGSVVGFAPITTKIKNLPTHVMLHQDCGLESASQVLLEQIRTLDKKRIKEYIGTVNEEDMKKVDKAIKISMGVYNETDRLMEVIENNETAEISIFKKLFNALLEKLRRRELNVA